VGYIRKSVMIGTLGSARLVGMRANSKKDRTAKALEKRYKGSHGGSTHGTVAKRELSPAERKAQNLASAAVLSAIVGGCLWGGVAIAFLLVLLVAVPFRAITHRPEKTAAETSLREALASLGHWMKQQQTLAKQAKVQASLATESPSSGSVSITPHATASSSNDAIEQIGRLAQLRDAGLITGEQFETKKTELLRRL